MKKHLCLTLLLAFIFGLNTTLAKIWRVNNNPGIQADFTTLEAAHAGAQDGDTLHLEGSPNSYGGLTATKKLVILGPGYFLTQNENTQALKQSAKVGQMNLNAGSTGSVIMGLDFNASNLSVFVSDIVIRRNKFSAFNGNVPDAYSGVLTLLYMNNTSTQPVHNIIIAQNYGLRINVSYASYGLLITNNYIGAGTSYGDAANITALEVHADAVALVQNNIFRNGTVSLSKSNFTNNIMIAGAFSGVGNLMANNLGNGTQFGAENGNQQNVAMSAVFAGGDSAERYYQLKPGSPAIGAGYGSTATNPIDAGMFSGPSPYVLSGLPPIPAIYFFENDPVGSDTDPINVTIKVKSVGN